MIFDFKNYTLFNETFSQKIFSSNLEPWKILWILCDWLVKENKFFNFMHVIIMLYFYRNEKATTANTKVLKERSWEDSTTWIENQNSNFD